jgi:hypothetical protein
MSDSYMQPEKSPEPPKGKVGVKGLDVTAMSVSFDFSTNAQVTVNVDITGSGNDTATFNLYGASDVADPGPNNGSHLDGPIASRPAAMGGSDGWSQDKDYTAQVIYLLNGARVKWKYTVPAASLNSPGPFSYPNNSMTRQPN